MSLMTDLTCTCEVICIIYDEFHVVDKNGVKDRENFSIDRDKGKKKEREKAGKITSINERQSRQTCKLVK